MHAKLLDIIVCPECKGGLRPNEALAQLRCERCRLAYPIDDNGIPRLIADEALSYSQEEDSD